MTIIHLARPLPVGSSDLPGGRNDLSRMTDRFGRAALLTPPYLVLHCEEFAWPSVSPQTPVRSYIKPSKGPHHFTHHLGAGFSILQTENTISRAGLLSVALVVARRITLPKARLLIPGAPPLAGSLPCSVRTFLSRRLLRIPDASGSDRPTCSQQGTVIIANLCSTGTVRW